MTLRLTMSWTWGLCAVSLATLFANATADACETPVYRYAMYRWQPAPYEVYFFHEDQPNAEQEALTQALDQAGRSVDHPANLIYTDVDLGVDPKLHGIPPDVKRAWTNRDANKLPLPSYLVSTPLGVTIYQGQLDVAAVTAMLDSPNRRSLGQQLEVGKMGVLVLVTGEDADANAAARQVIETVRAAVAAGDIGLYEVPSESAATEANDDAPKQELGFLEVDRADPDEAWLVRSLLAVEEGLDVETAPLSYMVYGRGRALFPTVGPGINRENLISEVQFISGACSCTVKEQNPGADLLVRYDWEGAAAALADRFGSEEGNESRFGGEMFFPELIIPTQETAASNEEAEQEEPDRSVAVNAADDVPTADAVTPPVDKTVLLGNEIDELVANDASAAAPSDDSTAVVALTAPAADSTELDTTSSFSSILVLGGGLCVALVALFGITLFVMRPS